MNTSKLFIPKNKCFINNSKNRNKNIFNSKYELNNIFP